MYFLLSSTEDGEYIEVLTREQMLRRINDEDEDRPLCVAQVPNTDMGYWGNKYVLIKGEIVVPQPVQTVTKWTAD